MHDTLFEMPKRERKPRRVIMHVVDAGGGCGIEDSGQHMVQMACSKCGYKTDWFMVQTVTEGRKGKPCPKCN